MIRKISITSGKLCILEYTVKRKPDEWRQDAFYVRHLWSFCHWSAVLSILDYREIFYGRTTGYINVNCSGTIYCQARAILLGKKQTSYLTFLKEFSYGNTSWDVDYVAVTMPFLCHWKGGEMCQEKFLIDDKRSARMNGV